MNSPRPNPLSESQIDQLIAGYCDGTISQADLALFCDWVRLSPANARRVAAFSAIDFGLTEYFRDDAASDLMAALEEIEANSDSGGPVNITEQLALRDQLRHERQARAAATAHTPEPEIHRVLVIPRLMVWGGLAAAAVLLAVLLWPAAPEQVATGPTLADEKPAIQPLGPAADPTLARITRTVDAVWQDAASLEISPLPVGADLKGGALRLASGFVEVRLSRGATMFVQGPAQFELIDANHARLTWGKMVAHVPPAATGFTLDTPTSRLIDIGTEFGVTCEPGSRQTTVQVYRGEVRAAATKDGQLVGTFISLLEQDAASIQADDAPQRIAFDPGRHVRDYADLLLTPTVTGQAQWLAQAPETTRLHQFESPNVRVYLERRALTLESDLRIDFVPNQPWPFAGIGANVIKAGTKVDVYLLHFDVPGERRVHAEATIAFGRPVLGGIGDGARIYETDAMFGHPDVLYPIRHAKDFGVVARGIDLPIYDNDKAQITRDRNGIQIAMDASVTMDQCRIFVVSADEAATVQP